MYYIENSGEFKTKIVAGIQEKFEAHRVDTECKGIIYNPTRKTLTFSLFFKRKDVAIDLEEESMTAIKLEAGASFKKAEGVDSGYSFIVSATNLDRWLGTGNVSGLAEKNKGEDIVMPSTAMPPHARGHNRRGSTFDGVNFET